MSKHAGWVEARLGEKCSIEIGGTPSRNVPEYWDDSKEGDNAWVSIRDLSTRVITDTAEYISDLGVAHSNAKLQPKGTVLLSFKLTIGRVAYAGRSLYTNEAIAGLRSKEISRQYLYYGLQQWDLLKGVDQAIKGATLNKEKLKKIEIDYPDAEPEQSKIAEILSTLDNAIEQTDALHAKQKRIRIGLMQELLTRGIDETGKLRSLDTHKFKNSELGPIPPEWEVMRAASICREIVVGIVIRPVQYYRPDGVSILRSANVKPNAIDPGNLVFMSQQDNDKLSKSRLSAGDVVTVRTGYPGTTAVVPPEFDGSNCVDLVISRPNLDLIRPGFLSIWVNSEQGMRQVLEGQGGLAQQHFNVGSMKRLLIKVPKPQEQEKIETLLCGQEAAMADTAEHLAKLTSLKAALMQDLLTGKKRVTPLLEKELACEVAHVA